jgi:uncharacterized protein YjiK
MCYFHLIYKRQIMLSLARNSLILTLSVLSLTACDSDETTTEESAGLRTEQSIETIELVPTIIASSSQNQIDLSNYKEIGRYDLPLPGASSTNLLAEEASAVTYNKDTDTLFVLGDGSNAIVQVSKEGVLIDSMTLALDDSKPQGTDFYDTEGIAYIGNGEFALAEERYRQISIFNYEAGTTLSVEDVRTVKLGTTIGNVGMEGISFDASTDAFIGVKQASPLGIFLTDVDFDAGTASNGSATTENSTNLFDPAKIGLSAINDVAALSNVLDSTALDYDQLLIVSAKDGKIVKIDREGNIQSTLDVGSEAQHEGITVDADKIIYIVNEVGGGSDKPQMFVYAPLCEAPSEGTNICLSFDQGITAGIGNIIINNLAGDKHILSVTDPSISFSANMITFNLSNLTDAEIYTVTYEQGVIKQGDNDIVGAMTDVLQVNLSGTIDITAPILESTIPVNNAINFSSRSIILTFNEPVIAGSGSVLITDTDGDQIAIDITDTSQVSFGGKNVIITQSTVLSLDSRYNLQLASGAITDLEGNAYQGIFDNSELSFDTATQGIAKLLITEVNSKADGGDFFELYNFGEFSVDLTGWTYVDSSDDATQSTYPGGTTIAPGATLISLLGNDDTDAFKSAWGIDTELKIVAFPEGEKLGKGDAILLHEDTGALAASFNYTLSALGGVNVSQRSDGAALKTETAHAGQTFGDENTSTGVSAVWDGVSTASPAYKSATADDFGAKIQVDELSISTIGSIPRQDNTTLLISEINSKSNGGDFFELYNFGSASLDLSGWTYDDSSASAIDGVKFPNNVVISAGNRLVVNVKETTETFKTIWNLTEAGSYLLLESGSGLGKGDAVVLFDAKGTFVTGVNYGIAAIDVNVTPVITLNPSMSTAGNIPTEKVHTGIAFGNGTDHTSAVWDEISTTDIRYTIAVVDMNGASLSDDDLTIASPGK